MKAREGLLSPFHAFTLSPSYLSSVHILPVLQTSSSLAFRSLLKTAAAKSGLGRPVTRLTGPTPAAAAFHAAAVAQDSVTFLVVPTDADVEQMTSDARFFLSALKGLSEAEAAEQVRPFPSQEVDPYRGLTPHFEIASARARALHGLISRTDPPGDRVGAGACSRG